jgi:serine phosphatase RsbU (regulator of sigma subunit)
MNLYNLMAWILYYLKEIENQPWQLIEKLTRVFFKNVENKYTKCKVCYCVYSYYVVPI